MKLRKTLTIAGLFFIILIVLGELLLPSLAEETTASRLSRKFATNDVEVALSSTPRLLLAAGHADHLSVVVRNGRIGQLRVRELKLTGSDAQIDCGELFHGNLKLEEGRDLSLIGTFDAEGLREALAAKLKQADNLQVAITDDNIVATADAKVFGRRTSLSLVGHMTAEDGSLYFVTDQLEVTDSPFGSAKLGDLVNKIQLVKPEQLPLGMQVRRVEQNAGTILIVAEETARN